MGVKENAVCTKVKKLVGCQGDLDGSLGRKKREDGKEYIFWQVLETLSGGRVLMDQWIEKVNQFAWQCV